MGNISTGFASYIAFIKQNLPVNRKINLEGNDENLIVFETNKERIVGLYRGFKNYREPGFDSLGYLFGLLEECCKTPKQLVLIGDFNIDPLCDITTPQGQALESLIINHSLIQLVDFPTRSRVVNRTHGVVLEESVLDLVLSTSTYPLISDTSTSDHRVVGVILENHIQICQTKKTIIRDWVALTPRNIARIISTFPSPATLEEMETCLLFVLNKLAPYRVIRTRATSNMINPKVEKIKKRRDRLYRQFKLIKDTHFLMKVKEENNKLKKAISTESKWIFQKKAESADGKSFWQMVGQLQGRVKKKELRICLDGKDVSFPML